MIYDVKLGALGKWCGLGKVTVGEKKWKSVVKSVDACRRAR